MNQASPVQLRKALEAAQAMVKEGIMFVPMPVADEEERNRRVTEANKLLEQMAQASELATEKEE